MITKEIINKLAELEGKKKLISGAYLTDTSNENFLYIKDKFFKNEKESKALTLNTGSGLFESVASTIAYYTGNPSVSFKFPTNLLVKDYVCFSYCVVGLERKNNKLDAVYLPAEKYIRHDGVDYIIRAYEKVKDNSKKFYYLVTSYTGGIISNTLYEAQSIITNYKEVPLDTIDETDGLVEIVDTGLDKCIWVIKDNDQKVSLVDMIKQIVYSIDRKIVMFDTQFLQNVESFVLLKGINLPNKLIKEFAEGNTISFQDLGRYITSEPDGSIEFVNNSNELIKDAIQYEQTQIKKISTITNIPLDFLGGEKTAGAIGEGSREMLHGAFIKRIIGIRQLFDEFITQIIDVIKSSDTVLDQYSRPSVFPANSQELINELSIALENRIISRRTAMKQYLDYSDDEIDIELGLIDLDNPLPQNNTNGDLIG